MCSALYALSRVRIVRIVNVSLGVMYRHDYELERKHGAISIQMASAKVISC